MKRCFTAPTPRQPRQEKADPRSIQVGDTLLLDGACRKVSKVAAFDYWVTFEFTPAWGKIRVRDGEQVIKVLE